MSTHYFKSSLAKGAMGEQKLLELFPALVKTDGRHGDVLLGPDKIEIKTDFYDSNKTQNFFIERYSDINVGSPGGPWQAQVHGCKYFMYWFTNCGAGWVWETDKLVPVLDKVIATIRPSEVKNVRWTTVGFKVPRTELMPLCSLSWCLMKGVPLRLTGDAELMLKLLETKPD